MDEHIRQLCDRAISSRVFPGCQVAYVRAGRQSAQAFGRLTYDDKAPDVTNETRYDVASVTKSVPTSSLLLKLIEDGQVGLDDPVIKYIPELSNEYREQILVRHLLTYTVVFDITGMAALAKSHPSNLLAELLRSPLKSPPGTSYFYTNAPAILMGMIIEKVTHLNLAAAANRIFIGPLEMNHTTFDATPLANETVAPSEVDDRGEVRGAPHDESTWALRESGHTGGAAGLFSTAGDLLKFAEMLLAEGKPGKEQILRPDTVALMHTNQLAALGEKAGLGWEMGRADILSDKHSPEMFMKTGFTGCLIMIDPEHKAALVHLSNRTYPQRQDRQPLRDFWRGLIDIVFE
jgi:CubicO group peptidase (beta-lactamase class C family)